MSREPKKLDELFYDTLKDVYFAEKKILTTLPKMAKAAQNDDLKAAFEKHRRETEGQVKRLEQVFAIIGKKPMLTSEMRCQAETCARERIRYDAYRSPSRLNDCTTRTPVSPS